MAREALMSDPLLPDLESLRVRVEHLLGIYPAPMFRPDSGVFESEEEEVAVFLVRDLWTACLTLQARAEETTTKPQAHVDIRADADDSRTGGANEATRCSLCDQEVPDNGDLVCVDCYDATRRELPDPVVLSLSRNDCYLLLGYLATRKRPAWLLALHLRFFDALEAASQALLPAARESTPPGSVSTVNDGETIETKRDTSLP